MTRVKYGQKIGSHLGKPIYNTITSDGVNYKYVRLANCEDDGGVPLNQLAKNEVLFQPGLIYQRC